MKPVTQINFFSIKPGNRSCCRRSGRTGDEDIHRPPRALLPFRAGRHVGDADESPKEVNRVEVLAYVAVLDRARHRCTNSFPCLGSFASVAKRSRDRKVQLPTHLPTQRRIFGA